MAEEKADYSKMTTDELLALHKEYSKQAEIFNLSQLGKKILLNSLYGACGNPYFFLYNNAMARGITLMGQCFIKKASKYINTYVSKDLGETEETNRIAYGDTDSVTGDTLLRLRSNNGDEYSTTIEHLFNSLENIVKENEREFVKDVDNLQVMTDSGYSPIKYVMKHRVEKELYKITVGDKSVIVTSDHSLIVNRENKRISVKPRDIAEGDVFISLT